MKKRILVLGFFGILSLTTFANAKEPNCIKSQDLDTCTSTQYREQVNLLDQVYKQVLKKYENNKFATKRIKAAQTLWIAFRDAQVESTYPKEFYYGSYSMCSAGEVIAMTLQRIKQLQNLLDPDETDICNPQIGNEILNK